MDEGTRLMGGHNGIELMEGGRGRKGEREGGGEQSGVESEREEGRRFSYTMSPNSWPHPLTCSGVTEGSCTSLNTMSADFLAKLLQT